MGYLGLFKRVQIYYFPDISEILNKLLIITSVTYCLSINKYIEA